MKTDKRTHAAVDKAGNVVTVVLYDTPIRLLSNIKATATLWKIHRGCVWPLWMLN